MFPDPKEIVAAGGKVEGSEYEFHCVNGVCDGKVCCSHSVFLAWLSNSLLLAVLADAFRPDFLPAEQSQSWNLPENAPTTGQ